MAKAVVLPQLEQPGVWEQVFREEGREILTAKAHWPRLCEGSPGLRRVSRYYDHLVKQWQKRWEGPLLTQAKAMVPEGGRPWTVSLRYEITLFTPQVLSLWWEVSEDTGERRPKRIRQGDIWALPQGVPVLPGELFAPLGKSWRKAVLAEVERQIAERLQAGESLFKEDWLQRIGPALSSEGFYLTEEGPWLFYPVESIAPALEDFPTFPLTSLLPPEPEEEQGQPTAQEAQTENKIL